MYDSLKYFLFCSKQTSMRSDKNQGLGPRLGLFKTSQSQYVVFDSFVALTVEPCEPLKVLHTEVLHCLFLNTQSSLKHFKYKQIRIKPQPVSNENLINKFIPITQISLILLDRTKYSLKKLIGISNFFKRLKLIFFFSFIVFFVVNNTKYVYIHY